MEKTASYNTSPSVRSSADKLANVTDGLFGEKQKWSWTRSDLASRPTMQDTDWRRLKMQEIDYTQDVQQREPICYDVFGNEIYRGDEYWYGYEGVMADPGVDNWDSRNAIIELLVRQLGTKHILEALGYEKRTFGQ